jgi:hypothetical protein
MATPTLAIVLQKITAARAAHTAAESTIFTAYVLGQPISSVVPAVNALIAADNNLSAALQQLLMMLGSGTGD